MKYIKMLGLAAVAAAALMAFVGMGTATATELTCGGKLVAGGPHEALKKCATNQVLHAVSEGKAVLDAPFGNIECESTVQGVTTNPGSSSTTASGPITKGGLTFTNCGNDTVHVLKEGTLEIHTQGASNNSNGTLTSTGAEVTVVHLGFHCIYETNNTDIGTLTGSTTTKGEATLDISATIPRVGGGGGAFCGASAPWTGSYKITTPSTLVVH